MEPGEIKYLCSECRDALGKRDVGFHAVNEVGRKFCSLCGSNRNDLNVVGAKQYEEMMQEQEKEKVQVR